MTRIPSHLRADNRHAPARIHYPAMLAELKRDGGPGKHHYDPENWESLTERQQQVRDEIMDGVWGQVPVTPTSLADVAFSEMAAIAGAV